MTALNASTPRSHAGARRRLGRRGVAAVALGAGAALALSACGAGQITQTDTQMSAVTGSVAHSKNGDITLNDVQLVLASQDALKAGNPLHLTFTAANANADHAYDLEKITVGGKSLTIEGAPATLCPTHSLTTRTAKEIEKSAAGGSAGADAAPANQAAGTAESAAGTGSTGAQRAAPGDTCTGADAESELPADASSAERIATIERLSPIDVDPVKLDDRQIPGTVVDVTFQFEGVEPMEFPVPVTVPQHWVRNHGE